MGEPVIWFVAALIVVAGVPAGWAAAHLVHRYVEDPETETALLADATCPSCTHVLAPADTAPPRWWLTNRTACPHCSEPLPVSWLAIQLAVPALGLAMLATFGVQWGLLPFLWLVPVLVVAAGVDMRLMLIPRRVAWIGFAGGLALIVAVTPSIGATSLWHALFGAALYFVFLFLVHVISPAGMGFGDVRLSLLLGLYLGWIAIVLTAVGLFLACVFGIILGLGVRMASDGERHFPFGPGLAAGTMVAIWFSTPILNHLTST
jgi:prepilin signal peptidase PulO-like enzyme (type II secretory pathway)